MVFSHSTVRILPISGPARDAPAQTCTNPDGVRRSAANSEAPRFPRSRRKGKLGFIQGSPLLLLVLNSCRREWESRPVTIRGNELSNLVALEIYKFKFAQFWGGGVRIFRRAQLRQCCRYAPYSGCLILPRQSPRGALESHRSDCLARQGLAVRGSLPAPEGGQIPASPSAARESRSHY